MKLAVKESQRKKATAETHVSGYRHLDKRKNNPEVGVVTPATDGVVEPKRYPYDPHIDPALEFDVGRGAVEKLIDDAIASGDEKIMREALTGLKRMSQPSQFAARDRRAPHGCRRRAAGRPVAERGADLPPWLCPSPVLLESP